MAHPFVKKRPVLGASGFSWCGSRSMQFAAVAAALCRRCAKGPHFTLTSPLLAAPITTTAITTNHCYSPIATVHALTHGLRLSQTCSPNDWKQRKRKNRKTHPQRASFLSQRVRNPTGPTHLADPRSPDPPTRTLTRAGPSETNGALLLLATPDVLVNGSLS
jgi:hypothetical protein